MRSVTSVPAAVASLSARSSQAHVRRDGALRSGGGLSSVAVAMSCFFAVRGLETETDLLCEAIG